MDVNEINVIITEFHSVIFKVFKICQKIEPNNIELEWLRKQISLARDIDPLLIINKCSNKIWAHREQIINEDESFFLNSQYNNFIKNDENKSFISELVNLIKKRYIGISASEKKVLWNLIKAMLTSIVKYKKATGDFA
jgi:hypothetical protein